MQFGRHSSVLVLVVDAGSCHQTGYHFRLLYVRKQRDRRHSTHGRNRQALPQEEGRVQRRVWSRIRVKYLTLVRAIGVFSYRRCTSAW